MTDRDRWPEAPELEELPGEEDEEIVADSNYVASIATPGAAESLNVAAAGAIALYERSRQIHLVADSN